MKSKQNNIIVKKRTKQPNLKRTNEQYNILFGKRKVLNYLRNELKTSTTHGLSYTVNDKIQILEK